MTDPNITPGPPRTRRMRSLLIFAAAVAILAAAAALLTSQRSVPAAAPKAAHSTPAAPASSAAPAAPAAAPSTPDDLTGPLGTEYDVSTTDDSGNAVSYTVTADTVLDPARGADEFNTPDAGNRFAGVKFTITGTGGYAHDDANNDAVIIGSDGQAYTADFSTLAAGTNFNAGDFGVTSGRTVTGWVTFQLPRGVSVASVQWQPGLGDQQPATWVTGPAS